MPLDLIKYGHLRRGDASPIQSPGLSTLITTATVAACPFMHAYEAEGVRRALLAQAQTLRWQDKQPFLPKWLNWSPDKTFEYLIPGVDTVFVESLIATAIKYHNNLREYETGLASIQRAFFIHGSVWAIAEWRCRRFDEELDVPLIE